MHFDDFFLRSNNSALEQVRGDVAEENSDGRHKRMESSSAQMAMLENVEPIQLRKLRKAAGNGPLTIEDLPAILALLESEGSEWLVEFLDNGGLSELIKVLNKLCTTIPEDDDERLDILEKRIVVVDCVKALLNDCDSLLAIIDDGVHGDDCLWQIAFNAICTCGVVVDPEDDLEVEPDPELMSQVSDILSALTSFNRDARTLVFKVCETLPIPGIDPNESAPCAFECLVHQLGEKKKSYIFSRHAII